MTAAFRARDGHLHVLQDLGPRQAWMRVSQAEWMFILLDTIKTRYELGACTCTLETNPGGWVLLLNGGFPFASL